MDAILRIITNSTLLVTKFLRMGLADKNDHPPFFDHPLYEIDIDEDEHINNAILSLNATDFDEVSHLYYEIVDGNEDGTFAVGNFTGELYLTQPLDYEIRNKYNLLLVVSDGRHESGTSVQVNVNDVNDNPPVFDSRLYKAHITEEDGRNLPRRIITVKVTDGDVDRPQDIVFSLSGQGVDIRNPQNSHFEIDRSSGDIYVRKPLDRDFPDGRPNWGLTVFAQDEGGTGLVSYSEVEVTLKDINDVSPTFPQSIYYGNITENGTSGLEIIRMKADDFDDPEEGTNAQLTYSIGKNAFHEITGFPLFWIESTTGVVRTAVCCLDREEQQNYTIQVIATDGGGLTGIGTVSISVTDVNDKAPLFTQNEWTAEIDETEGNYLPSFPILIVSVFDEDEQNDFSYKVVESSGFGAEKFTMVTNADGSGSLKVIQPLDFEDPKQRAGFNFQIQVNDKGEDKDGHVTRSWVKVKIRDINDNEPQFLEIHSEIQVFENTPPGTSLAIILASDPELMGRSKVSYSIDRSSDKQRHFFIDKSGTVKIQKTLDREDHQIHRIKILAVDDGFPAKTGTSTLTVTVKDVNDNAPDFLQNYLPIVPENQPPRKIIDILATDSDDASLKNGPPFHFRLDANASKDIKKSFKVINVHRGPNGDGMASVFSLREFDREKQKQYHVPIVIRDSGVPAMIGTSTLTVTIGDENDNTMQSGTKHILFYSYMGRTHGAQIGRVYVQDADDWDLNDKIFQWASSPHSNFKLNENNGMITMKYVLSETFYSLQFRVRDRKHSQSKVSANVILTVKHIPEKAVENAGSLRLANITDMEFVSQWDDKSNKSIQSKSDQLSEKIAEIFNLQPHNVHIFSVQSKEETPNLLDIFYSVYDNHYYQSVELNGFIMRFWKEIEEQIGINIIMVGINECLFENKNCDKSCTNRIEVYKSQYLIDANRTSFVGVHMQVIPDCVCGARDFSNEEPCRPNPCLHGGHCVKEENFNFRCQCPKGYDGPRCQILTRTFKGDGFAWFPPLEVCEESHLSLEFISNQSNGLIFYNGPITLSKLKNQVSDYIALELDEGQLRLLVEFGSGTLQVKIGTYESLLDGRWHRVDIFWNKEIVRMDLDQCNEFGEYKNESDTGRHTEISRCQVFGTMPPYNEFLNVNDPLQVGGFAHPLPSSNSFGWSHTPNGHSFSGCIRNLKVNSQFYDFANPGLQNNTETGCLYFEKACRNNSTFEIGCGPNGICSGSYDQSVCLCKAGWTGTTCNESTVPTYFENQSYVEYTLAFQPKSYSTDIQLRLRTWEESGEIIRLGNPDTGTYGVLEIRNSHLQFRYNLDSYVTVENSVILSSVTVSDGLWHVVVLKRYGATVILTLDGGEGRKYNETSTISKSNLLNVDVQGVTIGGSVDYTSAEIFTVQNDYRFGCLDDIRLDGKQLPLPPTLSSTHWGQATAFHNLASECISPDQCLNITCVAPLICQNLWMKHECRCPEGSSLSTDLHSCLDDDECLSDPCENGGICNNQQPSYMCHCPSGYGGDNCEVILEFKKYQPNIQALSAIIVLLFIFVSVALISVWFYQRHKQCLLRRHSTMANHKEETNVKYKDSEGGEGEVTILDLTALTIPPPSVVPNGRNAVHSDEGRSLDLAMATVDVLVTSRHEKHGVYTTTYTSYDDQNNYYKESGAG